MPMEAEEFGVPQLDRLLADVPRGATILLVNDPGVEAEPFLYQAAHHHLQRGEEVVYLVTNRSPGSVAKAMEASGFEPGARAGQLVFIDAFSALMGASERAAYTVGNPTDLGHVASVVERAAREHEGAVLLVDGLSTLADHATMPRLLEALPRLLVAARQFRFAAAAFTRWPYTEGLGELLSAFDGLVTLRGVEDRILVSQYFAVWRDARAARVDAKPRLYKVLRPGGVVVYIPKILVTGPYNAGKSSFIHAVSDTAVSVDRLGTTVALDHGQATVDGLAADVFGTPGQSRFDPILKMLAGQALGVIVVVDATKPETFPRAREMLQLTWKEGLPAIIAANKQDLPHALPPQEVARQIGAQPNVRVAGCVGSDKGSARAVLKQLVDQILAGGMAA
jgi:hypothetical protein